ATAGQDLQPGLPIVGDVDPTISRPESPAGASAEATPHYDKATADSAEPAMADVERLIEVLEDPAEREKLLESLRALRAVEEERAAEDEAGLGSVVLGAASEQMERFSDGVVSLGAGLADLPAVVEWLIGQGRDPLARELWIEIALRLATILGAAIAVRWLVDKLLARPRRMLSPGESERIWIRIPMQLARLLLALMIPAAFAATAYGVLSVLHTRETARLVVLAVVNAYLIVAVITAIVRELLAPDSAFARMLHVSGENAEYICLWVRRLAIVCVYGYFGCQAAFLLGLPAGAYEVLLRLVGLVFAGLIVVIVLQNRAAVAHRIRGASTGGVRARIADIWHVLVIVYVIACFIVWALAIEGGFAFLLRATILTVLAIALALAVSLGIGRLIDRGFSLAPEVKARHPGLEARANRYLPLLRRFLLGAVYVAVAVALFEIWGFGTLTWLVSESGSGLVHTVATILVTVLLALAASEALGLMIERYIRRLDSQAGSGGTRARTLLPLLRTVFRIVIIVLVVMIVLSELGIDIAPLLAGAGVIGLAIGFGAQKLVQDVITGFFILVEDSISIGDFVDLGTHTGTVESISIRSIRMRDLEGTMHTVPFSSVNTVKNFSRDFGYALMDIGVAYRENTDDVMEIMREVGTDMTEDPDIKRNILAPIDVLGVHELGDSAVVIRARFMTRPMMQWSIKREFLRRIKFAFDERGIEMPFPHRTLYFGEDRDGNAPPVRVRALEADAPAPDRSERRERPAAKSQAFRGAPEPPPAGGSRESD
ncbi:MAG: mechanosensitive ion channel, partial [Rhodospirillaceae bacterium]|nr:mechanosensitive ion channel [Rhodospirillaceae bacterium]